METNTETTPHNGFSDRVKSLQTLHDDLRVRAELARMELRDEWNALGKKVEHLRGQAMGVGHTIAAEITAGVEQLGHALGSLRERLMGEDTKKEEIKK